ncbi:YwpF-like family protein [Heyndrickxia acidiproducens]|uniref:YwpF-like family protein n=1 Tax=Heyndrickxia acidiproducens TaxID=1121084 RepID=UPI0003820D65|nr:YwpF-like family protein [Heyndrickxia acidiproducens]
MKTFKIVSLVIVDAPGRRVIPFIDGLIINKEDGKGTWLIEAYMSHDQLSFFREAEKTHQELETEVVITYANNDPAPLATHVCGIKEFGDTISVLLEGKIRSRRNAYAETLLEKLVHDGFEGEDLIREFKMRINRRERSATKSGGK